MKKLRLKIRKALAMYFWRRYMKIIPVPHPHGIPYERDPEAKCEFYEPFKRPGQWYFQDCETDGHYLCAKCVHNVKNNPANRRDFPCDSCEIGEMKHVGTIPGGGSMQYECDQCGHTASLP